MEMENNNSQSNNSSTLIETPDSSLDNAIDESLLGLPLDVAEQKLVTRIIDSPSKADLQKQFDLFNITQSKKNALRVIKLNSLLDKVEDQAIERFEKRPDQVSNKELLEYMNVVSNQIDRAQKSVDSLQVEPSIQVLNQKNELNINVGPQLDRDSKERVMDAISALLQQVQKNSTVASNPIIENKDPNLDLSEDVSIEEVKIIEDKLENEEEES